MWGWWTVVFCYSGGSHHTSKLISVTSFATYPNKVAQTRLVFGCYSFQMLVVLFSKLIQCFSLWHEINCQESQTSYFPWWWQCSVWLKCLVQLSSGNWKLQMQPGLSLYWIDYYVFHKRSIFMRDWNENIKYQIVTGFLEFFFVSISACLVYQAIFMSTECNTNF
jgi:hypothetical protein